MDVDDLIVPGVVVLIACVVVLAGVTGIAEWRTHNACTVLGYPGSRVIYPSFDAYCIKRVDQTDTIIPLSKVREAK